MIMENTLPEWATIERTYQDCPNCKKGKLDTRIKRSALVKNFLFFMNYKRYECSSCGHKAYIANKS